MKTYARVVFSKSTWLKGTIEKHTASAVKESQADFIVKARGSSVSPFQVPLLDTAPGTAPNAEGRVQLLVHEGRPGADACLQAQAQQQQQQRGKGRARAGQGVPLSTMHRSGSLRGSGGQLDRRRSANLQRLRSGSLPRGCAPARAAPLSQLCAAASGPS